jgi:hypothetical protein
VGLLAAAVGVGDSPRRRRLQSALPERFDESLDGEGNVGNGLAATPGTQTDRAMFFTVSEVHLQTFAPRGLERVAEVQHFC